MKHLNILFFICGLMSMRTAYGLASAVGFYVSEDSIKLFNAQNPFFQYTGRFDFTNPLLPRFWAPGVYITAKFQGTDIEILVNDEMLWDKSHNYISVAIDNNPPLRIKLTTKSNTLKVAEGLSNGPHTITICKGTESGIGYLEFVGVRCKKLLKPARVSRRIEFIGNSITCGTGSDQSVIACDKAEWYDQHNAYMSYGPSTARALNAAWMLTAVSGIGLTRSCCNMKLTMPDVFDKVNLREGTIAWNFSAYLPDVVTICLGQNDGIQDSTIFCSAYVKFIQSVRKNYPKATIVCLTSPMADQQLLAVMKKYINAVIIYSKTNGDNNVYPYFFTQQFNNGCGGHPDLAQHQLISKELTAFIKKIKKW